MKQIKLKLTGTCPLMLNNARTVNPFDEYSKMLKPLSSKRTKTEDDLEEISRIKFLASWYYEDGRYIMPAPNAEQSFTEAARERKLGKKFEKSFRIYDDAELDFKDKNLPPEQLYELGVYVDIRAVGIKNVKITTTRAIVPEWSITVVCWYDESQLNDSEVLEVAQVAGLRYGVGTYRRRYGKFDVKLLKK